ncbi:hypothetical protein BM613_05380 [Sulfoacidibacillus thermotolerans]|uniref:NodB homology domain-containing protein n=2 Tax=Sulfoacidibacillus thermotolerans TaxID=1765684 RepID=A0A2U3D9Z5_SULT2|nr:hypothetical protein BM613_05380 [Sulfoacidibacillus thermotolerans]
MNGAILFGLFTALTLGPFAQHAAPIHGHLYWEKRSPGHIVYSVQTTKKWVALTFDDGPNPRYTLPMMNILDQQHAHATFFVLGKLVRQYPQIVKELATHGHEIGNHTDQHLKMDKVSAADITACDNAILQVTGKRPQLLRPPGGGLSEHLVTVAEQTKHIIVMWSWNVDPRDWSQPGVQKIVDRVVKHVTPGTIILLHDGGGPRSQTVTALKEILLQLSKQGYQFVTIDQLLTEWKEYRPFPPDETHMSRKAPLGQ